MPEYDDATAYELDSYARDAQAAPQRREELRRDWSVVEGRALKTRPLSAALITAIKCAGALAITFAAVSLVKVGLISVAYGYLMQNSELNTELESSRYQAAELEVQNAQFANQERIYSIATQVYGMVAPEQSETVDLASTSADTAVETE